MKKKRIKKLIKKIIIDLFSMLLMQGAFVFYIIYMIDHATTF